MEESRSTNAKERKQCDEKNFRELCSAISVENVDIKAMFRIGIQKEGKNRPLKIVLNNKRERKQILDNARHIKIKAEGEMKKCVVTKDFTPR